MDVSGILLECNCNQYNIRYPRTSCGGEGELIGIRSWKNLKYFVPVLKGLHDFRTNPYPSASMDVRNMGEIFSDLCFRFDGTH